MLFFVSSVNSDCGPRDNLSCDARNFVTDRHDRYQEHSTLSVMRLTSTL